MHESLRRYHAYSFIFISSIAAMLLLAPAMSSRGDIPVDPGDHFWRVVLGSVAGLIALAELLLLIADAIRASALRQMTICELRQRLGREGRSHRYIADPKELRGMKIGALFFGICVSIALLRMLIIG